MTADEFRDTCTRLGMATVTSASRGLGCSPRQVDRYRAGEFIPAHIRRTLALLDQVRELRAEVRKLTRELDEMRRKHEGA